MRNFMDQMTGEVLEGVFVPVDFSLTALMAVFAAKISTAIWAVLRLAIGAADDRLPNRGHLIFI